MISEVFDINIKRILDRASWKKDLDINKFTDVILGYQNDNHFLAAQCGLIDKQYEPGTFRINQITLGSKFLEIPTKFDDWINHAVKDELKLIKRFYPELLSQYSINMISKDVIYMLNCFPSPENPLKNMIWYQEYPDILRRLILTLLIGNPDYDLNIYPNLTIYRRDFIFEVINWLERIKEPRLEDWLKLSVSAGLLGVDEKTVHAATSVINSSNAITLNRNKKFEISEIERVGESLWKAANSQCRIDATRSFFRLLEQEANQNQKIVSFPDDYLESIILLKFYNELLDHYPNLEISCAPRSIRCSNDATYEDLYEFIQRFAELKREKRFQIVREGPLIGGVNLLKIHPKVAELIKNASFLDVRGARCYEMMQGLNKETFFGFMVCREISESVTGLLAENNPYIYIKHTSGEKSFKGFLDRHKRMIRGKMFCIETIMDKRYKWEDSRNF